MKRILYLTFYFEPDLSAGSFRNTPLVKELANQVDGKAEIDVYTTFPNRYSTFQVEAQSEEQIGNLSIYRVQIPNHRNGMRDQIFSFIKYYSTVRKVIKNKKYDLVIASSSRLFTAYLAYRIAGEKRLPLYLDIRDIFIDTMADVLKNPLIKFGTLPVLRLIEKKVFTYASHINLISGGFFDYFKKFKGPHFTTFPNGIDDLFLGLPRSVSKGNQEFKVITYAGNIGEGQGLHKIIPQAAKELGENFHFKVIGDGGVKQKLIDSINEYGVTNVELSGPVNRKELLEIYNQSDFLFIHLNDYEAFKKVLPSKVFELGAYDKPIIAGVAGFANKFIEENISNRILFLPGDVKDMVRQLKSYDYRNEYRAKFVSEYRRSNINSKLAESMLSYLK
ncbi:MAG TPA: glycosyltransferase family 4 protein [Arachidicoccus sp.]|nr:glycosyltransferase family 4 protein [Arachidicoccus sp.]